MRPSPAHHQQCGHGLAVISTRSSVDVVVLHARRAARCCSATNRRKPCGMVESAQRAPDATSASVPPGAPSRRRARRWPGSSRSPTAESRRRRRRSRPPSAPAATGWVNTPSGLIPNVRAVRWELRDQPRCLADVEQHGVAERRPPPARAVPVELGSRSRAASRTSRRSWNLRSSKMLPNVRRCALQPALLHLAEPVVHRRRVRCGPAAGPARAGGSDVDELADPAGSSRSLGGPVDDDVARRSRRPGHRIVAGAVLPLRRGRAVLRLGGRPRSARRHGSSAIPDVESGADLEELHQHRQVGVEDEAAATRAAPRSAPPGHCRPSAGAACC